MDHSSLVAAFIDTEAEARHRAHDIRVVHAPGRVNLIGEHTDYNHGFVLPVAIDLGISIAFVPTVDRRVSLTLLADGHTASIDLDAIGARTGTWVDYVAGVAAVLHDRGARIGGFRGVLAADLPAGAGLSSSAALELAVAWALGGARPPLDDPLALARAAQAAENEYVGVPCGLMDQVAVTFGEAGSAVLLDCRSLEIRAVPIPDAIELLVIDSGQPRRLAGSGYGDRQEECRRAVEGLRALDGSVESLRDIDLDALDDARSHLDDVAFRRARHVVTENARVLATARALESGDAEALGPILTAGHASLRDDFEVSTTALDRLADLAMATPGVLGARLTGAGFGGCLVAIARPGTAPVLAEAVARLAPAPGATPARAFRVRASRGAGLAWSGA